MSMNDTRRAKSVRPLRVRLTRSSIPAFTRSGVHIRRNTCVYARGYVYAPAVYTHYRSRKRTYPRIRNRRTPQATSLFHSTQLRRPQGAAQRRDTQRRTARGGSAICVASQLLTPVSGPVRGDPTRGCRSFALATLGIPTILADAGVSDRTPRSPYFSGRCRRRGPVEWSCRRRNSLFGPESGLIE
jgi:hypothetical protein